MAFVMFHRGKRGCLPKKSKPTGRVAVRTTFPYSHFTVYRNKSTTQIQKYTFLNYCNGAWFVSMCSESLI